MQCRHTDIFNYAVNGCLKITHVFLSPQFNGHKNTRFSHFGFPVWLERALCVAQYDQSLMMWMAERHSKTVGTTSDMINMITSTTVRPKNCHKKHTENKYCYSTGIEIMTYTFGDEAIAVAHPSTPLKMCRSRCSMNWSSKLDRRHNECESPAGNR